MNFRFHFVRLQRVHRAFQSLLFAVASLQISSAHAYFSLGPVAASMGGAGRAAVDPDEVGLLNPAAVGLIRQYTFGAKAVLGDHTRNGLQKEWGVVIADNGPTELIAGSLAYQRRNIDLGNGRKDFAQDVQVSVGQMFGKQLVLGLAVHRFYETLTDIPTYVQNNAHLGILWTPTPSFGLALTAQDILPLNRDLPTGVRLIPTYGFGANWVIMNMLHLRLDLERPTESSDGRNNVMLGLQTFFQEFVAFRLGANFQEVRNETWLTTGIGFRGPKLSVDYSFEKDIRQAKGFRHSFDLWMPF